MITHSDHSVELMQCFREFIKLKCAAKLDLVRTFSPSLIWDAYTHEMRHAATYQNKLMKGSTMHALDHSRLYARHSPFLLRFPM